MAEEKKEGTKDVEVQQGEPQRALSPFEEMDRMFDRFMHSGWMRPSQWEMPRMPRMQMPFAGKMPSVDVIDGDEEITIRAEVPGVAKDDLEITMTDTTVTIKGKTSHEEKEVKGDYFRQEISRGSFTRTVALPSAVDTDQAKTTFKDGLLELTAPKIEKVTRRTIKVE